MASLVAADKQTPNVYASRDIECWLQNTLLVRKQSTPITYTRRTGCRPTKNAGATHGCGALRSVAAASAWSPTMNWAGIFPSGTSLYYKNMRFIVTAKQAIELNAEERRIQDRS